MGLFYMKKFDQYVRHLQVLCRAEQEDVWLEMLRDRNDATHIYNEEAAQQLVEKNSASVYWSVCLVGTADPCPVWR